MNKKIAKLITEKGFQKTTTETLTRHGWTVYHTHDSRRSAKGYPDITAAHPEHGILFAELKTEKGKTTPDQEKWLELLSKHAPTYLWRPSDWSQILETAKGNGNGNTAWRP